MCVCVYVCDSAAKNGHPKKCINLEVITHLCISRGTLVRSVPLLPTAVIPCPTFFDKPTLLWHPTLPACRT